MELKTTKDNKYINKINSDPDLGWDEKMSILVKYFGETERTIRKWLKEDNDSKNNNKRNFKNIS